MVIIRPLVEVKVYIISHHLKDDTDKLAGTMPKGVVMSPAFSHLFIVVSLKGGIVFNNVMRCIYKCIPKYLGSSFGHPGMFGLESS